MTQKDLISSYVDGESTNSRIASIEAARNLNANVRQAGEEFFTPLSGSDVAWYNNRAPQVDYDKRSFGEGAKDAWHLYYQKRKEALIDENDDVINSMSLNMEDARLLMDLQEYNAGLKSEEELMLDYGGLTVDELAIQAESAVNRLRRDGVFTENRMPDLEDLEKIYQNSKEKRDSEMEWRNSNMNDLLNDRNNWDVSQYATHKSNESAWTFGNFLYKTAGTLGSSHADIWWQLLLTGAGIAASAAASAAIGAATGTAIAPGVGTAVGGVAGGITGTVTGIVNALRSANVLRNFWAAGVGATVGLAAGGMQSRIGESRMEAYNQYQTNLEDEIDKRGIDRQGLIDKGRQWVLANYPDVGAQVSELLTDDDIFDLIANGTISIEDNMLDLARRSAYRGTRALFEKNMALEGQEFLTDMLLFAPAARASRVANVLANPSAVGAEAARAVSRIPTMTRFLKDRLFKNTKAVQEALPGRRFTGKALARRISKQDLKDIGIARLASAIEEGTEEGAQYIWSKESTSDEYRDRQASTGLMDALINGNLFSDIADSWLTRARSTLAAFTPFDPVYSDDDELVENYLAGAMLSITEPRQLLTGGHQILQNIRQYKENARFGDLFARALDEQDFVDRSVDLLLTNRAVNKSGRSYYNVLERVREALKSGLFDLGAITDNNGEVSDAEIDAFIDGEKKAYMELMASREAYSKQATDLGLSEYDTDVYIAIVNNLRVRKKAVDKQYIRTKDKVNELERSDDLLNSSEMNDAVDSVMKALGINTLSVEVDSAIKRYILENTRLSRAIRFSQQLANLAEALALLKQQGLTSVESAVRFAELKKNADELVAKYLANAQAAKEALRERLLTYRNGTSNLNQLQEQLNNLQANEVDADTEGIDAYTNWVNSIEELRDKTIPETIKKNEKQVDDAVNSLGTRVSQNSELLDACDHMVSEVVESNQLYDLLTPFVKGEKSTKKLVDKLKQRMINLARARDEMNQAATQGLSEVVTEQQVEQLTDEALNNNIVEYSDRIAEVLTEASAVNPTLQRWFDRLAKGMQTIPTPTGRINYLRNSLKNLSKRIKDIPKDQITLEELDQYNQLKQLVDQASAMLDLIDSRVKERQFNSQMRPLEVSKNPYVWTAPDGKKYQFLSRETEHSIDTGVVLHALDVTDSSDVDEIVKKLNELDKEQKKLAKIFTDRNKPQEEIDEALNKYRQNRSLILNLEQDRQNLLQSRRVDFVVNDEGVRDYLEGFTRQQTRGKDISFKGRLDKIVKESERQLEELKKKRAENPDDNGIEEVPDGTEGAKDSSPDWIEKKDNERVIKRKKRRAKAYPFLGSAAGTKFANRLLNPYYQAKQWAGTIFVQRWEDVQDLDFANEVNKGKLGKGQQGWDRQKAYKTFWKLCELCEGKTPQQVLNFVNDIKQGKINTISKAAYENMLRCLPITTVLYNERLRTDGLKTLMPTRLVMPDITSRNRTQKDLSDEEYDLRENMILNMLPGHTYDGRYTHTINVARGNVSIYYRSILLNTVDAVNPENPILYDEEGNRLSQGLLNDKYDSWITSSNVADDYNKAKQELYDLLIQLGYKDPNLLNKQVTIGKNNEPVDATLYFLRNAAKYGDGLITKDTFINSLKTIFGGKEGKIGTQEIADRIVDKLLDICPQLFLTYDQNAGHTWTSAELLGMATEMLNNGWSIRLDISVGENKVVLNSNTLARVTAYAESMERALIDSQSRTEFIEQLRNMGFKFPDETAKILAEYFMYRKMNKLVERSSILNVLTGGKSIPADNRLIENRVSVVKQDKVTNVQVLGILKDPATGKLFYSRLKYATHILELTQEEDAESEEDPLYAAIAEENKNYEESIKDINKKKTSDLNAIIDSLGKPYAEIVAEYNSETGLNHTKRVDKKVILWYLEKLHNEKIAALEEEIHQNNQISEIASVDAEIESDFEGLDYEPVTIGYGVANGAIMRYDTYSGQLTVLNGANGSAGSVYLILPSFFNANRNRVPIKLNPLKIDINVARVIARIMYNMANGRIEGTDVLTDGLILGLKILNGSVTAEDFVRSLMYYGTEAIQTNPSNENLQRLVFIKDGTVYYGDSLNGQGRELTEDTIEEFAQWITRNKNYRMDKDMLQTDSATVRGSWQIVDENGETILEQTDGDNYIASILESGRVTTDMDTSKKSTIFGGTPQVYMEYTDKFEGLTPAAQDTKQKATNNTTAEKDGQQAKKELDDRLGEVKNLSQARLNRHLMVVAISNYFEENGFTDGSTVEVRVNDKIIKLQIEPTSRPNTNTVNDFREVTDEILKAKRNADGKLRVEVIVDGNVDPDGIFEVDLPKSKKSTSNAVNNSNTNNSAQNTTQRQNQSTALSLDDIMELETLEEVENNLSFYWDHHKSELSNEYKDKYDFIKQKRNLWLLAEGVSNPNSALGREKSEQNRGRIGLTPLEEKQNPEPQGVSQINVFGNPRQNPSQPSQQSRSTLPVRTVGRKPIEEIDVDTIDADLIEQILLRNGNNTDPQTVQAEYLAIVQEKSERDRNINVMSYFEKLPDVNKALSDYVKAKQDDNASLHSAVKAFFRKFVRMENYEQAVERAKRILGEDFNFDTFGHLPVIFDEAGHALAYVYGVTTANGIRLYRDVKNRIKRGVAYHEAFHRVSMLIMSPQQREKMYETLYQLKPEMRDATEREKQEYLADMFAKYVLNQISNENPLFRFLNTIGERIKKLVTRLRRGVKGENARVQLNGLFHDMYSGKYAYMKASELNEEYFRLAFEQDPLYNSYRYDGREMARDAKQFNTIFRNLLAIILLDSKIISVNAGNFKVNYDSIRAVVRANIEAAQNEIDALMNTTDRDYKMIVAAVANKNVWKSIDDNWKSWRKYLNHQLNSKFSLERIDDPNNIDYSDFYENDNHTEVEDGDNSGMVETIQNHDTIIEAFRRNQFKSLSPDVKLFLYSIKESGMLDSDGLVLYANVKQLWHELCTICLRAENVEEMINIINVAARASRGTVTEYTLRQVAEMLNDENTSDYIKNKLFSNLVKYTNDFVIANYRIERSDDSKSKQRTITKVDATLLSSNQEKSNSSTIQRWTTQIISAISLFQDSIFKSLPEGSRNNRDAISKAVNEALKNVNLTDKDLTEPSRHEYVVKLLNDFGITVTEDELFNFLSKQTEAKRKSFITAFNSLKLIFRNSVTAQDVYRSNLRLHINSLLFDPKKQDVPLRLLAESLSGVGYGKSSNDSVRIAGGAIGFIIGQYNHITRFFNRLIYRDDFVDRFDKDPYTRSYRDGKNTSYEGSHWRKYLKDRKNNFKIRLKTLAATMLDSDYNSSNNFMTITRLEDMMNKLLGTFSGLHVIPELANKKTFYFIEGPAMVSNVIGGTVNGSHWISDSVIELFKGYIISEWNTIRVAMRTRDKFIKTLNKVCKTNYTYRTFSALSVEELEKLLKTKGLRTALGALRKGYHFKAKDAVETDDVTGFMSVRSSGIDLTLGAAYKTRHFNGLLQKLGFVITEDTSDSEMFKMLKNPEVAGFINNMLLDNIEQVIDFLDELGIISKDRDGLLQNKMLPVDLIKRVPSLENLFKDHRGKLTSHQIYQAIAYFTVNNMVDIMEFEKLVAGDIALYGSKLDSVNKRYSAQTSTTSIKNDRGSIRNEFVEDELYDSPTYNVVEINTNTLDMLDKYKSEGVRFLGVDAFDAASGKFNYSKLLDGDGHFTEEAKKGVLVQRYLDHRKNHRNYGLLKNGEEAPDAELARRICENCEERLKPYRSVNPTDGATWISADMNRALKQREGEWTYRDECCHNLLEHYDELHVLLSNPEAYDRLLKTLGIFDKRDELELKYKQYKDGKLSEKEYAGYILSKTRGFVQGSLKYVFFGTAEKDNFLNNGVDDPIYRIYDKTSLSPIYKIFTKGHEMEKVYNFMKNEKVHMIKMESSTKTGNLPSFELYNKNGEVDFDALNASPRQAQAFENLGKQLNTDPHDSLHSYLLTQFMKIAMMNLDPNATYYIGKPGKRGKGMKRGLILKMYNDVLNELTKRGYNKFCNQFGIDPADPSRIDKRKFAEQLQDMAAMQGCSPELVEALSVDDNGEFIIQPSALPNINWVQSKLISAMQKTIIKTSVPGKPLFQVASMGYDNLYGVKTVADSQLRSDDGNGYMEVKMSVSMFRDVLELAGLSDASFDEQRKFILENQEALFALSYRVPTQGLNSTLAIKVVDVLEELRGDIVIYPADITALTGSDFDIDKMFLARYNLEYVNGKLLRVGYDLKNLAENSDEGLQNLLLDMYCGVLSSNIQRVDTVTPLDVTTNPLKAIKNEIEELKGVSKDPRLSEPGFLLNPILQVTQREKNASSSSGVGPMALNNVFRFFLQCSGLKMRRTKTLDNYGLSLDDNGGPRMYDRDGESILDSTSALINAEVDAVKDNYIGRMNVNTYTFDVVSFLISNGFGNNNYWFLGQQGLVDVADNYLLLKTGNIVADEDASYGNRFLNQIVEMYLQKIGDASVDTWSLASAEEMTLDALIASTTPRDTPEWYAQQIRYINTFLYFKQLGQDYRNAMSVAQIDTGKYGISANDIINFMLTRMLFESSYNVAFENPSVLFDNTFLGEKYRLGVAALFDMFKHVLFEFTPGYVNTLNSLCKQLGIFGSYGKELMKRIGQRLKTATQAYFFNALLIDMYPNSSKPLRELIAGNNTVVDRLSYIKERTKISNEGKALLDVLIPSYKMKNAPKFFIIDPAVREDEDLRSNVTNAWRELYESGDPVLEQYAKELAIYMFYVSGGTDSGLVGMRTTIFDLVPPQLLANLETSNLGTYNNYMQRMVDYMSNNDSMLPEPIVNVAMNLNAMFDDKFAPVIRGNTYGIQAMFNSKNGEIISVTKGSNKLLNYSNGLFREFIKIPNQSGYAVYRLGDIRTVKAKNKSYINPVYYKITDLGYRSKTMQAFAIRTDGYSDANGVVRSLYSEDNGSSMTNSTNVAESVKNSKTFKTIPVSQRVDFSLIYDSLIDAYDYNGYGIPYASFAAVDDADIVLFVNEDINQSKILVDYSAFKDKDFRVIDANSRTGYTNQKVALIGNASRETVDRILEKMPKATFIISEEANPIGTILRDKLARGEISGKEYVNERKDNSQSTKTSEEKTIQLNLADNGEKRLGECK